MAPSIEIDIVNNILKDLDEFIKVLDETEETNRENQRRINMSWEEYAKIVLGNKKVAEIKKEYNLCTKKYTYGRYKEFIKRLKKECKQKEKEINER